MVGVLLTHRVCVNPLLDDLLRCVYHTGVLVQAVLGDFPEPDLFLRTVEVGVILLNDGCGRFLGL